MHDIVNQLFAARDAAHALHLKSRSFAKHMALGELYEKLLDKTDELAEVWQGKYGIMDNVGEQTTPTFSVDDPIVFINQLATWSESIKQHLNKEDTHILNIWDEIVAAVYKAKYKLENLA